MRLLLVEDEWGLVEALKAIFTKENYCVDICMDGESGLDYALTGIYDLIILDIMLPRKDGLTVLQELRKTKIETPVLMLTAKTELEDKIVGLDYGADDYLTKPFQTGELLARIRAVTRRKGEVITNDPSWGDLILRQKTREIICGTASVKLGLKEFLLLETLIVNSRQIISKEQLIEKVWGFDSEAEYNNVEVYISFLRKKINFVGSHVQIKVNRGIGYFLEMTE
ncbi:response regulator transcription factor [Acetobacterium sp.]|jgi:DNA-binding response OmpR family regulator|uniref:response regulator transcription factor n=1 Tax=Acetobacterium sp. TaxID=1872094 RepID=UPI000CC20BCA|nr:response regulator transcription factor [Acetobacterium sp.]MDO9492729.1 response regulator transcription factor [Acetobacterium sp.]PKM71253.1 MAG: DNA-binding response regulator [Firmicutes bacterium HGW-Firmicutes-17]